MPKCPAPGPKQINKVDQVSLRSQQGSFIKKDPKMTLSMLPPMPFDDDQEEDSEENEYDNSGDASMLPLVMGSNKVLKIYQIMNNF
jgi:hypothetical protein